MLRTTEPKGGGARAFTMPCFKRLSVGFEIGDYDRVIVENTHADGWMIRLTIRGINDEIFVDAADLTAAVRECTRQ